MEKPISAFEYPSDLEATQLQLQRLWKSIAAREVAIEPFDLLSPELDDMDVDDYTSGEYYDETMAPIALFQTQDGKVLRLAAFRHPDTNKIIRQSIQISHLNNDSMSRSDELYTLVYVDGLCTMSVDHLIDERGNAVEVAARRAEVEYLQEVLDGSTELNLSDLLD